MCVCVVFLFFFVVVDVAALLLLFLVWSMLLFCCCCFWYGPCCCFVVVVFGMVHVAHRFSSLCCTFCIICLCSVSCVKYCLCLQIVHSRLSFRFSLTFNKFRIWNLELFLPSAYLLQMVNNIL